MQVVESRNNLGAVEARALLREHPLSGQMEKQLREKGGEERRGGGERERERETKTLITCGNCGKRSHMHHGKVEEAEEEGSDKYEVMEGNSDFFFKQTLPFFLNSSSTTRFSSQELEANIGVHKMQMT